MLLAGLWYECDDGEFRPVIRAEVLAADGSWVKVPILVDTAADQTAFSADVLKALAVPTTASPHLLHGVGGAAESVVIATVMRMTRDDGGKATFRGHFSAFTDTAALDMSVLGRNITNEFAVIIDRPGNVVCLLHDRHRYVIEHS